MPQFTYAEQSVQLKHLSKFWMIKKLKLVRNKTATIYLMFWPMIYYIILINKSRYSFHLSQSFLISEQICSSPCLYSPYNHHLTFVQSLGKKIHLASTNTPAQRQGSTPSFDTRWYFNWAFFPYSYSHMLLLPEWLQTNFVRSHS